MLSKHESVMKEAYDALMSQKRVELLIAGHRIPIQHINVVDGSDGIFTVYPESGGELVFTFSQPFAIWIGREE